jgi:small subunit ribosomal protein S1
MEAVKKYAPGTKHKGKVVRLQPFGAFVELEPGIDGLIHTADISIKRVEHPSEVVKVNDEIDIVVASVDGGAHKIALHPALQGDEANETPQRVHMHKPVKVKVVLIEQNGLVVRVMGATGRNARGYIPAGGTGTPRGTELRKAFNVGQELEAKVIDIDSRRGEVKLSVRALNEDTERSAYKTYQQQVKKEARFTMGDLLAKKLQK